MGEGAGERSGASSVRIAVVGDVHLAWDERDREHLDGAGYDLVAFVGDLAGYRQDALGVAQSISRLRTPAFVVPGNHDGVSLPHLAAETFEHPRLARLLGRGQRRRCEKLRRALEPVPLAGYSRHEVTARGFSLSVIAGRPHSQGGSFFAFARYLAETYGVRSFDESAERLRELVDEAPHEHLVFVAHNGPSGLGASRDDIWGCDFKLEAGDFGDADLRAAIEYAQSRRKRVLAVAAGHMHHRLKGGGKRKWLVEREGVLYVNAARVPRIQRSQSGERRHHVLLEVHRDGARAELVTVGA